jgi:hypothetical protein
MSAAMRTLDAAPGVALVQTGLARSGALIASLPVRYQKVGFLERPLVRDRPLGPSRVVLASNSPVFATRFASGDPAQRLVGAWCGVAPEDGRPTGFCLLDMRAGPQAAEITRGGSPYMPREIAAWYPTDHVGVREDASAQTAMPAMEITYGFTEFDTHDVDVMTGVRVAGGAILPNYNLSLPREADGSAIIHIGGGALRLRPGPTRRDVIVEQVAPVMAYNPQSDEAELRILAGRIHERLIARASQPPPAAPPRPGPAP